ncbi:hypothetical protein MBLNU459_g0894t1 [Dothideomycetes sp. NU459]
MPQVTRLAAPPRKDERIIIHFDYDCFYASVFEAETPALKSLPLAVQQKQIIVTCNYEARRRGLHKLQLIKEAKKICPDVIIVLGEDISRFRDASKELYQFLNKFSWNTKVERLGFDEVWMDVTDIISYNIDILNVNTLQESFFQLAVDDPTQGFAFNATIYAGHTYGEQDGLAGNDVRAKELPLRLRLGSHLAMHLRHRLEDEKGYTSTVGISTSKLLAKLAGSLHKPKGQTTLLPPYESVNAKDSNVTTFIDGHDVGNIPGIGYKLSQKLRAHVLNRPPDFEKGLIFGATREKVSVRDVRLFPGLCPEKLETILGGPGSPHGIGNIIWNLIHGVDDSEVSFARPVPRQISIEDSYIRLDTLPEVLKELNMLSRSLINRMRIDLVGSDEDQYPHETMDVNRIPMARRDSAKPKWLAHPRTIRLSTRPRLPLNADGTRTRTFKRISHSAPLPNFIFSLTDSVDPLAERLVQDTLVHMFRRLHPEKGGWNLSLVNIAVTNMAETGGESKTASGRNIGNMFRRQEDVLKDFRVIEEEDVSPPPPAEGTTERDEDIARAVSVDYDDADDETWEVAAESAGTSCETCGLPVPSFAMQAHQRYHLLGD